MSLESDSNFQRELGESASGSHAFDNATAIARRFAETDFVQSADQAAHGTSLVALLQRLRSEDPPPLEQLRSDVREAVDGADPGSFTSEAARARDSVLASYLLADGPHAGVAQDLVRAYALADAVLSGSPNPEQVEALVRGPIALPGFVASLRDAPSASPPPPSGAETARALAEQINHLAERHRMLSATIDEVAFHAEDELVLSELGERQPLSSLYRAVPRDAQRPQFGRPDGADQAAKAPAQSVGEPEMTSPLLRASARRNVVFSERALELLPDHAVETLRSLDLDPASASIAEMQGQVLLERHTLGQELTALSGKFAKVYAGVIGIDSPIHIDPYWNVDPVDAPEAPPALNTTAPTTHTPVKALGIADLLLVRAHISHYERAEVAAIENVLAHERLTHTVRRLDTTETTSTDDKETTDLRSQTQTTAEQDNGHTTVQAVGPGVGPLAAEGASSFAKTVTDQVSSSSTNRARRISVQRQLRETEDTTEHLFDNTTGAAATYGVYQWLDKVYTAQAYSYGSRLLYDVIVPEPAALFREALARPRSGLPLPVKPAKFAVLPTYLTLDNWAYYASGHHATGVDAPPAAEIVVTEPFGGRAKDEFSSDAVANTYLNSETRSTRIPKGYRADRYRVAVQAIGFDSGAVQVVVGSKYFTIGPANGTFLKSGRLDGETESLPVGVNIISDGVNWGVMGIIIGVEIICTATDELFSAWQARAHGQILDANQRRFQDYEEAVANRDASARIFLQTLPAARKVSIVRTEMQRAALELLTGQSFGGFNATGRDAAGFPFPDAAATTALSAYIRFFEQAVEWEHVAYAFYPYFWGSQGSWVSKLLVNESDAQFAGFLTSGAARVVLPVRPGYEAAFERFLNTGTTPTTDMLLDVGSPLWVSLVADLRRQNAEEGQETEVDEPWQFRIATDLLRARGDGSMPQWSLTQGKWHDAADPNF